MFGIEAHADVNVTDNLIAEMTYDWVQGSLTSSDDPLPRIPPFRVLPGLRYQRNALQFGGSVTITGGQDRVFGDETPTAGDGL